MSESPSSLDAPKLALSALVAYAAPMVAINFSLVLFMSYINSYAIDVLLVPPVAMGIIFGAGRLWDAVTDPIAGILSDRTEHRLGRRRPWILLSAIPTALFGWMVWSAPETLSSTALILWMTVAVFGFNAAITFFLTPHQALGAELTLDHHQVSRIFAARQAAGYIGMIGCLVYGMPHLLTSDQPRQDAELFAIVAGIAIVVTVALSVAIIREPAGNRRRGGGGKATSVARDVWANRHARMLLIMIFIEHAGAGASMVVSPFTFKYVLMQPYAAGEVFKWYVGSSLVSLALWLPLSRKIGKKQTWMIGLFAGIAGYVMIFMLGEGDVTWMKGAVVLTGACSACGTVIGSSILADVIDADELETGDRKEGAYYSAYTFLYKASSGVMASLTGFVLAAVGYVASQPEQTETVRLAIRSLHGLIPVVTMLVGAVILTRFSLTEETHAEIRSQLEARRNAATPAE